MSLKEKKKNKKQSNDLKNEYFTNPSRNLFEVIPDEVLVAIVKYYEIERFDMSLFVLSRRFGRFFSGYNEIFWENYCRLYQKDISKCEKTWKMVYFTVIKPMAPLFEKHSFRIERGSHHRSATTVNLTIGNDGKFHYYFYDDTDHAWSDDGVQTKKEFEAKLNSEEMRKLKESGKILLSKRGCWSQLSKKDFYWKIWGKRIKTKTLLAIRFHKIVEKLKDKYQP